MMLQVVMELQVLRDAATKTDEFSEKFQTAFPPLIFGKSYWKFFILATKPSKVAGTLYF